MDFDALRNAELPCTAGVIVMDKSTDVVRHRTFVLFHKHESCGQCTPPRGHRLDVRMMERLVSGEAESHEIDTLEQVTRQIEGHTICIG